MQVFPLVLIIIYVYDRNSNDFVVFFNLARRIFDLNQTACF